MGLEDFLIEFDKAERSYFAGQSVSGKVILQIREEKKIEALQLSYYGHGHVQWKAFSAGEAKNNNNAANRKSSRKNNRNEKLTYPRMVSAEEVYLKGQILLVGKIQEDTSITLLPGKHEYPFEFHIPSESPSTFLGSYGHVKYFITATLKRPNSKRTHVIKVPFTVNGVLDLNTLGNLVKLSGEAKTVSSSSNDRSPQQQTLARRQSDYSTGEVKKFTGGPSLTSCLCLSKSVGFQLTLSRVAFVPGEYIQFVAEMRNMSKVDVSGVTLSLIQETKYYAEGETKTGQKIVISSAKGPSVSSGECEIWETNESDCLFLDVPSIPPTNLATCQIIGVEYILQLEMEIYGRQNLKGQLPILIGTIPLKSTFNKFTTLKPSKDCTETKKQTKSMSEVLGYPGLVTPAFQETKTYTLSSTTSALPPISSFIKPPGKSLKHFSQDTSNENGNKDEDSDDGYHEKRKHKEDLDLNFIPMYAKYISVYGED